MRDGFISQRMDEKHTNWIQSIKRETELYSRNNDIRTDFERDYTRLLHSNGYRRLKHKTQVFFAPKNDHICTRIEHVNHVASVSSTIAKYLGLNDQLTNAIAIGHDIGHAPFGHHGEQCLRNIYSKYISGETFWHEKNSLFFVDSIETLQDPIGNYQTLNLTYAVRDGIICHCGEIDDSSIFPRVNPIDLLKLNEPGEVQSFTWEGCVVKISDKIAYIGRDIEDAIQYKMFDMNSYRELREIAKETLGDKSIKEINTTVLINDCIVNLCSNSSIESGLCFSPEYFEFVKQIKAFNYRHIYKYWRIEEFKKYATQVIQTIFDTLFLAHKYVFSRRKDLAITSFPKLYVAFYDWLIKYSNFNEDEKRDKKYVIRSVFNIDDEKEYVKCIVSFISGMTDQYAISLFEEIITF